MSCVICVMSCHVSCVSVWCLSVIKYGCGVSGALVLNDRLGPPLCMELVARPGRQNGSFLALQSCVHVYACLFMYTFRHIHECASSRLMSSHDPSERVYIVLLEPLPAPHPSCNMYSGCVVYGACCWALLCCPTVGRVAAHL